VFINIVTESKTCHIYKVALLIIKVSAPNDPAKTKQSTT
jgi:hypothetical protein